MCFMFKRDHIFKMHSLVFQLSLEAAYRVLQDMILWPNIVVINDLVYTSCCWHWVFGLFLGLLTPYNPIIILFSLLSLLL